MLPRARKAVARSPRDLELGNLLVRAGHGDRAAFALLYEATHHGVYASVLTTVRDPAQSEEVTQETYLRVWQTASSYDKDLGSAQHWIYLHSRRCAVDWIRKAESLRRLDAQHFLGSSQIDYDETAGAVHDRGEIAQLHEALDALTPIEREAIQLVYFDEQTHAETAQTLRVPPGTAKGRIRAGVTRLRSAFAESDDARSHEPDTASTSNTG